MFSVEVKMNLRKQKFIEKFLECGDASKAAVFAGYSKKHPAAQGQRLLNDPEVKAAKEKALAQSEIAAAYNANKAFEELDEIKRAALSGENPQCSAAAKAVELKCKLQGLLAPEKREIDLKSKSITFEQLCITEQEKNDNTSGEKI
jgi:phage terminase small subunit